MMKNSFFNTTWVLGFVLLTILVACEDENITSEVDGTVENYVLESVESLEDSAQCGRHGCFELVFPVSISFPDETTAEVNDFEELRDAISTWKTENTEVEGRPGFVYPIEVVSSEGEVITVNDAEELSALRIECGRGFRFGRHARRGRGFFGKGGPGTPCFEIVYPITIQFPDSTTAEVADRESLKGAVRNWREDNPGVRARGAVVFPIEVQLDDESIISVESKEALRDLKGICQESSDDA